MAVLSAAASLDSRKNPQELVRFRVLPKKY